MSFKKKSVVVAGRTPPPSAANLVSGSTQSSNILLSNHATRPSLQTSHPCVSSGSQHLDDLLGHGGIPLGSLLLIEESGTTDFGSVLLRSFAAQGILHSRLAENNAPTKVIVIGAPNTWGRELPGVYIDKTQAAKGKVEQDISKLSVESLTQTVSGTASLRENKMKISWRYSRDEPNKNIDQPDNSKSIRPHYSAVFDFTSRLVPQAQPHEISYITPSPQHGPDSFFPLIINQLEMAAREAHNKGMIIRVVIPTFLHPAIYSPNCSEPQSVLPFMYTLKTLCQKYSHNIAVLMTLPVVLYPRESTITRWFEILIDGCIHLEGFPDNIEQEKEVSSAESSKAPQGLVHIYKLPASSERGMMMARPAEHAFRVGRKLFEIQEWGIPVEVGENESKSSLDY